MQRIHGLRVASDRPLPGLPFDDSARVADVQLTFRDALEAYRGHPHRYRSDAPELGDAALTVFDIAPGMIAFRYSDGTAIDVDLRDEVARLTGVIAPDQTLDDFVAYLYGPVLGFVLRSRGVLALHASAVVVDTAAVLLVGSQGAGKSTTAAALVMRGCLALSDDLSALELTANTWIAQPAFDFLRVWPASEPILYGRSGVLSPLSPGWDKRRVPLSSTQFAARPAHVAAIYLLAERETHGAPRLEDVSPRDALLALVAESYANYLLSEAGRVQELSQVGNLLQTIPVRRVVPHADAGHLSALCDLILTDARTLR